MIDNKPQISEEVRVIPWWAYMFAAVSITATGPYFYFHGIQPGPYAALFRAIFTVTISCIIAFLVLLVGYVNRDAKRRNMNSALWTVLVIFIPNAIGFIIYFLLRQPLMVKCPECGTLANPTFNYCPKCKYNLRPTCPKCTHVVRPGDAFCPQCAYELKGASAG
jgi:hypothetical protein